MAKLFLDHKTLLIEMKSFLFYILCEIKEDNFHFVGFFSKVRLLLSSQNTINLKIYPAFWFFPFASARAMEGSWLTSAISSAWLMDRLEDLRNHYQIWGERLTDHTGFRRYMMCWSMKRRIELLSKNLSSGHQLPRLTLNGSKSNSHLSKSTQSECFQSRWGKRQNLKLRR